MFGYWSLSCVSYNPTLLEGKTPPGRCSTLRAGRGNLYDKLAKFTGTREGPYRYQRARGAAFRSRSSSSGASNASSTSFHR